MANIEIEVEWDEGEGDEADSDFPVIEDEGITETYAFSTAKLPNGLGDAAQTYQELALRASFQAISDGCLGYSPKAGLMAPDGTMLMHFDTYK